jgi:hypothetical protein
MPADLDEAIEIGREIIASTPSHEDRLFSITKLAELLITRYSLSRSRADLQEAISRLEEALKTADTDDAPRISQLITALHSALDEPESGED